MQLRGEERMQNSQETFKRARVDIIYCIEPGSWNESINDRVSTGTK